MGVPPEQYCCTTKVTNPTKSVQSDLKSFQTLICQFCKIVAQIELNCPNLSGNMSIFPKRYANLYHITASVKLIEFKNTKK